MKNNDHIEAYKKAWQNVQLSASARARIEENLARYAEFHAAPEGVRVGEESRSIERVPQESISGISFIRRFRFNTMTAFILVAVLIGGGTSFAAEGSLPGDLLYPIKVEVNEGVKGALAFGSEAEARLQADLVRERLEEAEELGTQGMLTAEVAADIEARMKAHAEEARTLSAEADAKGDAEVAAEIRAELRETLEAYETILADFTTKASNTGTSSLIIEVGNEHDATVEAEADASINFDIDAGILKVDAGSNNSIGASSSSNEGSPRTDEHETTTSTDVDIETGVDVDTNILDTRIETDTNVRMNTGVGL